MLTNTHGMMKYAFILFLSSKSKPIFLLKNQQNQKNKNATKYNPRQKKSKTSS
jgi:hypothetical protein